MLSDNFWAMNYMYNYFISPTLTVVHASVEHGFQCDAVTGLTETVKPIAMIIKQFRIVTVGHRIPSLKCNKSENIKEHDVERKNKQKTS